MILRFDDYTPEQMIALRKFFAPDDPEDMYREGGLLYTASGFFTHKNTGDIRVEYDMRSGAKCFMAYFNPPNPCRGAWFPPMRQVLRYNINPVINPKIGSENEWLPAIWAGHVYMRFSEERTFPPSSGLAYISREVFIDGSASEWFVAYP